MPQKLSALFKEKSGYDLVSPHEPVSEIKLDVDNLRKILPEFSEACDRYFSGVFDASDEDVLVDAALVLAALLKRSEKVETERNRLSKEFAEYKDELISLSNENVRLRLEKRS